MNDIMYVRGFENGERIDYKIEYRPYMFVADKTGRYNTLDGTSAKKLEFDSIKDAKDYINKYGDIDNFPLYGLENFPYVFINDEYPGQISYDPSLVSIVSLDIECIADQGFPSITKADKEITAITIRKNGYSLCFGCGDFVTKDRTVKYFKCENEKDLLHKFLMHWNEKYVRPDIVTGWNVEFFDIPYLYNRIKNVCGDTYARQLSPWGVVFEKEILFNGKKNQTYEVKGISILDYLQVYKKFKFGNQESYKLDYIAQEELGEKKIDYSEYGSILELYKNNFQKFMEYNIHDTVLVDRLEAKLKFLEQIMAFAYDAKVNYNDTMTTVRPWDVIIHNYLLARRIVIPRFKKQEMINPLVGGYVKNPKIGLSKWVVSFDVNSMYPTNIIQFNISPDTRVTKTHLLNMLKHK
jgi:DNA polymerase elongation subunit (family B)